MGIFKELYPADSVAVTMTGFGALASSATWVAGWEFGSVSNRVNQDITHVYGGKIEVGTTPTINTLINIYIVPATALLSGAPTWPDVMDGTASVETWTSAAIRDGSAVLARSLLVDATTSNRDYYFSFDVRSVLGFMPWDYVIFIAHNTGVNLNSTDGNHAIWYTREQLQAA